MRPTSPIQRNLCLDSSGLAAGTGTLLSTAAGHDLASHKPVDPSGNNFGGAADTRGDVDGLYRAIFGAGAALHTGIVIFYGCLMVFNRKDTVWTDDDAAAAADTGVSVQAESGHLVDITKILHSLSQVG